MKRLSILVISLAIIFGLTSPAFSISLGNFIPFGTTAGDFVLPVNDDGSSSAIPYSFTFYGNSYSSLWVNNNGNLTFDGSMSVYTPYAFPSDRVIIAPYFADVDTRGDGTVSGDGHDDVYYSVRTGSSDLNAISAIINAAFGSSFSATSAFVATWDHVGYYSHHSDLSQSNTFQVALATDGMASYAIFNYLDDGMYWETGDASGGSGGFGGSEAAAGFYAGDNVNYYILPGSWNAGIANILEQGSNCGVAGQWVFQINNTNILQPPSPVPIPPTIFLLLPGIIGAVGIRRKFA